MAGDAPNVPAVADHPEEATDMNEVTSSPSPMIARQSQVPVILVALGAVALVAGAWLAYQANSALQALNQLAAMPADALAANGVDATWLQDRTSAADLQLWLGFGLVALAITLVVVGGAKLARR